MLLLLVLFGIEVLISPTFLLHFFFKYIHLRVKNTIPLLFNNCLSSAVYCLLPAALQGFKYIYFALIYIYTCSFILSEQIKNKGLVWLSFIPRSVCGLLQPRLEKRRREQDLPPCSQLIMKSIRR